jgi:hypothetical protein
LISWLVEPFYVSEVTRENIEIELYHRGVLRVYQVTEQELETLKKEVNVVSLYVSLAMFFAGVGVSCWTTAFSSSSQLKTDGFLQLFFYSGLIAFIAAISFFALWLISRSSFRGTIDKIQTRGRAAEKPPKSS